MREQIDKQETEEAAKKKEERAYIDSLIKARLDTRSMILNSSWAPKRRRGRRRDEA